MPNADTDHVTPAPVLRSRYEWVRELGRGGQGRTFLARDLRSGHLVAVKELLIEGLSHWKAMELFEREAQALKSISHPAIPAYIDFFQLPQAQLASWREDAHGDTLFLVQEFVDGVDFKRLLAGGLHFDTQRACDFLDEMLGILSYLHRHEPAVIHRDIKPSNIILRADTGQKNRLALVDFGAVQAAFPDQVAGSTVVGTSGYMPLEQLMGRAVAASDLYALGATLVHLLSQRHPHTLPLKGLYLQFQSFINVSPVLQATLEKMLAAHIEDRFESADEARKFLAHGLANQETARPLAVVRERAPQSLQRAPALRFHRPGAGQKGRFNMLIYEPLTDADLRDTTSEAPQTLLSTIEKSRNALRVTIPRAAPARYVPIWVGGAFFVGLSVLLVKFALASGLFGSAIIAALLCIALPLAAGVVDFLRTSAEVCIEVNPKHLCYTQRWWTHRKSRTYDLESIQAMRYRRTIGASLVRESPIIGLQSGKTHLVFGGCLPDDERQFLMASVTEAILAARE